MLDTNMLDTNMCIAKYPRLGIENWLDPYGNH